MPQPLTAFTNLGWNDAVEQWIHIRGRGWPAPGTRQVTFLPVETLLCLCASLGVDHRRYGSSTAHLAPKPVPSLARLFKRPPSSILAKMANLDGSRSNGGKNELQAGVVLLGDPARLTETYLAIVRAARTVGIQQDELPDFMGLERGYEFNLRGQDELDDIDLAEALALERKTWSSKRSDLEDALTTKIVEVAARVGQHRFAGQVLTSHGHRCVFCGLRVETDGAPAKRMLVASHIKPWRECTTRERLDPRNGLTACPTHDVAFDTGLVGVGADLRVLVRHDLLELAPVDPATDAVFGALVDSRQLLLPRESPAPRTDYLHWHGVHIYQGEVA